MTSGQVSCNWNGEAPSQVLQAFQLLPVTYVIGYVVDFMLQASCKTRMLLRSHDDHNTDLTKRKRERSNIACNIDHQLEEMTSLTCLFIIVIPS